MQSVGAHSIGRDFPWSHTDMDRSGSELVSGWESVPELALVSEPAFAECMQSHLRRPCTASGFPPDQNKSKSRSPY